jgi:acetyl-CoA carboxylase biotin carboxyl carrier protein
MSLSYKDVADIIKIIDASSCEELVVELADAKIIVRRGSRGGEPSSPLAASPIAPPRAAVAESPGTPAHKAGPKEAVRIEEGGSKGIIRSPMVGTFYRAPSPTDPPFVDIGSIVNIGDPLCVIEVMKLFTTIAADRAGTITSIFPGNAELVEFDQPLFEVESA